MFKKKNTPSGVWYVFLFLLVVFSIFGVLYFVTPPSCKNIDCISFSGKEEFVFDEVYYQNKESFVAQYHQQDTLLRMEMNSYTDYDSAVNTINSRVARILAQFEEGISPYPGEISDSIVCPPEFKPQVERKSINGIAVLTFTGLLNSRKSYGTCQTELIEYNSYNYYFICEKTKKVFFLEFIRKVGSPDFILENVTCS